MNEPFSESHFLAEGMQFCTQQCVVDKYNVARNGCMLYVLPRRASIHKNCNHCTVLGCNGYPSGPPTRGPLVTASELTMRGSDIRSDMFATAESKGEGGVLPS